jgi:hypothetical protein
VNYGDVHGTESPLTNPQRGNLPSIADRKNNLLAYRHGRWRLEWLRLANQCKPRIVERRAAGASHNSAADKASLAIKAEDNQHRAFFAAQPRTSRILLPAFELSDNLHLPRLDRGDLLWRALGRCRSSERLIGFTCALQGMCHASHRQQHAEQERA